MSVPRIRIDPSIFTLSIRSFIRFRHRRSVDFPQPEGPMRAVTELDLHDIVMSKSACFSA